jgi:hypothetical protein
LLCRLDSPDLGVAQRAQEMLHGELDSRAAFWAFGTIRCDSDLGPGYLDMPDAGHDDRVPTGTIQDAS